MYQFCRNAFRERRQPWANIIQRQAGEEGVIMQPAVQRVAVLGKFWLPGGVHHIIDKLLHRRLLDPFQVITDAHIENKGLTVLRRREWENLFQQMQNKPCFKILIPRFLQRKFRRPFGVKAFVFGIDAGFFQLKPVENLYGFQLDKPPTGEPGGDDILRQLGMWPGGGADWGGAAFAEDAYPALVGRRIELLLRNTKNGMVLLILIENARQ